MRYALIGALLACAALGAAIAQAEAPLDGGWGVLRRSENIPHGEPTPPEAMAPLEGIISGSGAQQPLPALLVACVKKHRESDANITISEGANVYLGKGEYPISGTKITVCKDAIVIGEVE